MIKQPNPTKTSKQQGFTLIELTLATVILASLLLVITQIFVSLVRQQATVVSMQAASQNVRYALDDITSTARSATGVDVISNTSTNPGSYPSATPASFNQICFAVGNNVVQYFSADPRGGGGGYSRVLYKRTIGLSQSLASSCNTIWYPDGQDTQLVSDNNQNGASQAGMNVSDFRATTSSTGIPTITVRLAITTDLADIDPSTLQCYATHTYAATAPYCSIAAYETTISLRGTQNYGP